MGDAVQPTTTLEEDRLTASARNINLIWEVTQAVIALTVVGATVVAALYLTKEDTMLGNAFFLVIGFYFGRTNHARTGGVIARSEK